MLTAWIIGGALGYLGVGVVVGGISAYREDPDPGRPRDSAEIAAGAAILLWPLIPLMYAVAAPYNAALAIRLRLIARRERKQLPEARVV